MDSLTHLVLSGAGAGALVPKKQYRVAILTGMALGTVPDLDVFLVNFMTQDPIMQMTDHRGFSHSLLVMPFAVLLLWWGFKRFNGRIAASPWRWLLAMQFAVISHLLLDALTVYGTQLWWPFKPHPTMWSGIFIIDPVYTLILLVTFLTAWFMRRRSVNQMILIAGLVMSIGYISFGLKAKAMVERAAHIALTPFNLQDAPRFSSPLPFNILLWRVIVMTPEGYLVGDRSIIADETPMRFYAFDSDITALAAVKDFPSVKQLQWFNSGFTKAEVVDNKLIVRDLRLGFEPHYFFSFVIAEKIDNQWQAQPPIQIKAMQQLAIAEGGGVTQVMHHLWQRIWHEMPGLFNHPTTEVYDGR